MTSGDTSLFCSTCGNGHPVPASFQWGEGIVSWFENEIILPIYSLLSFVKNSKQMSLSFNDFKLTQRVTIESVGLENYDLIVTVKCVSYSSSLKDKTNTFKVPLALLRLLQGPELLRSTIKHNFQPKPKPCSGCGIFPRHISNFENLRKLQLPYKGRHYCPNCLNKIMEQTTPPEFVVQP